VRRAGYAPYPSIAEEIMLRTFAARFAARFAALTVCAVLALGILKP
jgi:hypothetical protein